MALPQPELVINPEGPYILRPIQTHRWLWWLSVLAPALACGILITWATANFGISVTHDSILYMDAAKHIAKGQGMYTEAYGFLTPLTHYPPGYPSLLAVFDQLGFCGKEGARFLAIGLGAALAGLVAGLAGWVSRRWWLGLLAGLCVGCGGAIMEVLLSAWSETSCILFIMSGLGVAAVALSKEKLNWALLFAAGLAFGLAVITRYAAIAALGAVVIITLFQKEWPFGRRVVALLVMVAPSMVALGIWLARNAGLTGNPANRTFGANEYFLHHLTDFGATISSWGFVVPDSPVRTLILLFIFIVWVGLFLYDALRRPRKAKTMGGRGILARMLPVFAGLYVAMVTLSIGIDDNLLTFDSRIMSPVAVAFAIWVFGVPGLWLDAQDAPQSRADWLIGLTAVLLVWVQWNSGAYLREVSHREGMGFSAKTQVAAPVIEMLNRVATPEDSIYAPHPYDNLFLGYLLGRVVRPMQWLQGPKVNLDAVKTKQGFFITRWDKGPFPSFEGDQALHTSNFQVVEEGLVWKYGGGGSKPE